jgi:hypothetical protein
MFALVRCPFYLTKSITTGKLDFGACPILRRVLSIGHTANSDFIVCFFWHAVKSHFDVSFFLCVIFLAHDEVIVRRVLVLDTQLKYHFIVCFSFGTWQTTVSIRCGC